METIESLLTGKFLISTPKMPDRRFAEHVIFICSHSTEDGAMGLAVNQPYGRVDFREVLGELELSMPEKRIAEMYVGGPVEPEAGFILFETADYSVANQMVVTDTIAVSREKQVLEDLARGNGPKNYLFLLGYTGWGAGQLEAELTRNGWLVLPGSNEIIFHVENSRKWVAAAEQYGIDIAIFEDETGSA